jgi:hypothetical protein
MKTLAYVMMLLPTVAMAGVDHLVPMGGIFANPAPEYFAPLRTALLSDTAITSSRSAFEVYVVPSFDREWRLALSIPANENCTSAELSVVETNFWSIHEKQGTVKILRNSACIPTDVAKAAQGAVRIMLRSTRVPDDDRPGFDGTTYYFVGTSGWLEGTAWSPPEKSRPGQLAQLVEALKSRLERPQEAAKYDALVRSLAAQISKRDNHGG